MSLESVLALVQVGAVGIMLTLFVLGLIYPKSVVLDLRSEITELKDALEAERDRANAAVTAASGAKDVIAAIQAGLQLGASGTGRRRSHD